MAMVVVLLEAAVIATFIADPGEPPQSGHLWQALWALKHQGSFVPLLALAVVGPFAGWLAWSVRGRHRRWLAAGTIVFTIIAAGWFAGRLWVMARMVWLHGLQ